MARCVADPRAAGFAGDRSSLSDMLSPVSPLSRIMGRKTTVFGTCTCPKSAYADSDEAGRVFRFEGGHRSDLKAATVPI
jgi:hypothetical protein